MICIPVILSLAVQPSKLRLNFQFLTSLVFDAEVTEEGNKIYRDLKQDFLETGESKTIDHSKHSEFNQAKERNASSEDGGQNNFQKY